MRRREFVGLLGCKAAQSVVPVQNARGDQLYSP